MAAKKMEVSGNYQALDNPLTFWVQDDGQLTGPTHYRVGVVLKLDDDHWRVKVERQSTDEIRKRLLGWRK